MKYGFVGPYGSANLGDYAILINNLFEFQDDEIVIFSYNTEFPKRQIEHYFDNKKIQYVFIEDIKDIENYLKIDEVNFEYLEKIAEDFPKIRDIVNSIDVLIISVGGWLNNFWFERKEKAYKLLLPIIWAKKLCKRIEFTSNGIGPFDGFESFFKSFFNNIDTKVRVRDLYSFSLISETREGIEKNVEHVPDDLLLPCEEINAHNSSLKKPFDKYIVMELFLPIEQLRAIEEDIKSFALEMENLYGLQVVLLPFDLVWFGEDQAKLCNNIIFGSKYIDISNKRFQSVEDVLFLIKNAQFVISSRYHGLVLSLSVKTPVIHILKEEKLKSYHEIKGKCAIKWCFNKNGFVCDAVYDVFLKNGLKNSLECLKNNYNDIRDTQLKLYDSESYKLNIKEAKKIREKMIKDIKTHD
ncbi:MAG: polysaccharide pyruvyl transferase family protein [Clostridia bacterium]|nr:polysaccharide pyruvyl transferase family protein [Clostridia bacterium]